MQSKLHIAGVGGKDRSGKDTLADLFIEAGYFGFSFGDAVRRHTRERHHDKPDPISVANMTETANWLRAKEGADVILREALDAYQAELAKGKEYKGLVLYSVRAPIEVDFILSRGGDMYWVQADDEVRLKRRNKHIREGEAPVTMQQMLDQEDLQIIPQPGTPVEAQMNLPYVESHATRVLTNNGDDLDEFMDSAKKFVQEEIEKHK